MSKHKRLENLNEQELYKLWCSKSSESLRISLVLAAVDKYPDKLASECIELFYLNGLTLKEIARSMKSRGEFVGLTQKQRMNKIRYKIETALKRIRKEVENE